MRIFRSLTVVVAATLLAGTLFATPHARAKEVTFVVEAEGIAFSPNRLQVDPGDNVTIVVYNNETTSSGLQHTFDLDEFNVHIGTRSDPILPGQSRTATFTATREGTFYFYCNIPLHATNQGGGRWTGMVGILQVGDAPPPADPTPVIVGGLVVLFVSLASIAFFARRKSKKQESS